MNDETKKLFEELCTRDPLRAALFALGDDGQRPRGCPYHEAIRAEVAMATGQLRQLNRSLLTNSHWTLVGSLGTWIAICIAIILAAS